MNIKDKINEVRDEILATPNGAGKVLADRIALAGKDAILVGMRKDNGDPTDEWIRLMTYFKNNKKELDRLCGQDDAFNDSRWGPMCLAYIAGNSLCTVTTTETGGTLRNFSDDMEYNLDAEVGSPDGSTDLAAYSIPLVRKKGDDARSRRGR